MAKHNLLLGLLLFGLGILVCVHVASAARGGGSRVSVRFSSSRYSSYRYSSYRYSSYRYSSYRYSSYGYSSGSFRTSSYNMAPMILTRKGGYYGSNYGSKQMLMMAGSVYIAHRMRPTFYVSGGSGWGYSGNYDDYAICEANVTGVDMFNRSTSYKYFLCPSDITSIFEYDEKYCCGTFKNQHCCDEEAFYMQYGVLIPGPSAVVIAVSSVFSILFLCCCCGLLVYCGIRRRAVARGQPVPTGDPDKSLAIAAPLGAYPLQPMQQPPAQPDQYDKQSAPPQDQGPGYAIYPTVPAGESGAPYPGAGAPPYPSYGPVPTAQPPPYPGPV